MSEKNNDPEINPNKYMVGPGLGLIIMGLSYLLWWIAGPWAWQALASDPRWAHNWVYALAILNVGLAWYHKSPVSRTVAMIQSFMIAVTGSGSFDSVTLMVISILIFIVWLSIVLMERSNDKNYLEDRLNKRELNWITMHTLIIAWLLITHIGLLFFIGRLPLEAQLMSYSDRAGYLANLPPESLEFATWVFDIGLFVWGGIVLWEQFKMGYNFKNEPWPKYSFYVVIAVMAISLLALLIQELTIGFDWAQDVYG